MLLRLAPRPLISRAPPGAQEAAAVEPRLSIALLVYRGNPRCGGQGVYVRHLSRALADLGHRVEVLSGPPYPDLDRRVRLTRVRSLDLYREPDPFRFPRPGEFRSAIDLAEFALMCTAGFPEPLTFSLRALRALRPRLADFDVIHDNQGLGYGLLPLLRGAMPVVATIHHPITIDRRLDLAAAGGWRRKLALRRWYGFVRMQTRLARRVPRILTVSESSQRDLVAELGVDPARLHVVHLGVDTERFRPRPEIARIAGKVLTTASADVPLKGLLHLVEAFPALRLRHPEAHLVVVGRARQEGSIRAAIRRLGLDAVVRFEADVSDERLQQLYAEAEAAVVPSLYEGFSLPAVEAMASGCAVVATRAGAIPEVVGSDGGAALLVPPGDAAGLAAALGSVLASAELRSRLGEAGRRRALDLFSWRSCALATVAQYRAAIATHTGASASC